GLDGGARVASAEAELAVDGGAEEEEVAAVEATRDALEAGLARRAREERGDVGDDSGRAFVRPSPAMDLDLAAHRERLAVKTMQRLQRHEIGARHGRA